MQWIILLIINWIVFIALVDWKQLKKNIWAGLFAMVLQYAIDSAAILHGLYTIHNPIIEFKG